MTDTNNRIELVNQNARNLYNKMLNVMVETGYPKSYPIDVMVDFEIITQNRLYEPFKCFIWIIHELGTHLYYEDYIRDFGIFKMHFENQVKRVFFINIDRFGSANMIEIIPTYQNALNAYNSLPDHEYKSDES